MEPKHHSQENNESEETTTPQVFFQGYPGYPPKDDIYLKSALIQDTDPADPSIQKITNQETRSGEANELNDLGDLSGNDLDVPGSELDDADEITGNEDEENNLYSLGSDNHDES